MGRTVIKKRKERDKKNEDEAMGFGGWGGYMEAKKSKLLDQFHSSEIKKLTNIFEGIAIHVNGLTKPPSNELKDLMAAHGGVFHMYQVLTTTHIIASNLPNVKVKQLGTIPIVKPSWITDSIALGKLLDYRRYLLYTNQSRLQPRIDFPVIEKPSTVTNSTLSKTISDGKANIHLSNGSDTNIILQNEVPGTSTAKNENVSSTSVMQKSRGPTKTAADPTFLQEFYQNSRLHLISTLGAEFKHLVCQMREKSKGEFPGKEKLILQKDNCGTKGMINSIIMHIDMDCFFVSVGLKKHPELKGQPIAITHARSGVLSNLTTERKANREQEIALYTERLPNGVISRVDKIDAFSSMSEIASCSYEARKYGIRNGMFLGQAVKMCPNLKTLPYDFEGYKEVSHILYNTIASYTLDIEAVSCDEMYVDVTRILRDTGLNVDEWATHIRNEIMTATGCPCSTGFGANRLQARLATRKAKPSGQYYLETDDVETYMAEIPLADLPGVGRATLNKLEHLGLKTCGDVQVTSLKVLQSEIGQKAGETLKDQARGIDNKPLNFNQERKSVSTEVNYGIRFKTLEECHNFLKSLSQEVYNRLRDINMKARSLTLKLLVRAEGAPVETAKFLGCGVCDSLTKSTTSNIIFNSSDVIFNEVKGLYNKLNPSFVELRGVGIHLSKLEKNTSTNSALSSFLKQGVTKAHNSKETELDLTSNKNVNPAQHTSNKKGFVSGSKSTKDEMNRNVSDGKKKIVPKQLQSRRGRAKGSKVKNNNSMKIASATYRPLNIFLRKNKEPEPNITNQKEIHSDRIDLNVLNELPAELRKEIFEEYQLGNRIQNSLIIKPQSALNREKLENQSQKEGKTAKSPFSKLTMDEMRILIRKWTQSEQKPTDIDSEMIAMHFKQMAISREIEKLHVLFNFIHRIFSDLSCDWHKAYYTIVNFTQHGMLARYNGTLKVKSFVCCKM